MSTRFPTRMATAVAAGLAAAMLSLPALAVDTGGGGGAPAPSPAPAMTTPHTASKPAGTPKVKLIDLDAARKLIAKNDWSGAIKLLKVIVVQQPRNADALNLYGYALRNAGQMKSAESWYLKALKLQPKHLGANEYLGELYVMTGQMDKARARLATIEKICGNTTCEEYADLSKAIAAKA